MDVSKVMENIPQSLLPAGEIGPSLRGGTVNYSTKSVSRSLLPQRGCITKAHAEIMYQYRHVINPSVHSTLFSTESEVMEYQRELAKHKARLMLEFNPILVDKILEVAKHEFNWINPRTKQAPNSLRDLKDCIADKEAWKTSSRKNEVYTLMFGIFKKPNEQWLKNRVVHWMLNNKIEYEEDATWGNHSKGRRTEGCYFSVVKGLRHDSFNKSFSKVISSVHGCEMVNSDQNVKRKRHDYHWEKLDGGNGYLKRKKNRGALMYTEEEGEEIMERLHSQFGPLQMARWCREKQLEVCICCVEELARKTILNHLFILLDWISRLELEEVQTISPCLPFRVIPPIMLTTVVNKDPEVQ